MKLLTRYNRVNIPATVLVLLISGFCYYYILSYELINQLDNDLKVEEQEIIDYVNTNKELPNPSSYKDQVVTFTPGRETVKRKFSSLKMNIGDDHEYETQRQIEFPIVVNKMEYKVTIRKSQEETDDLIKLMLMITISIILVLLLVLFIVNRFILNKLWKPFNTTLSELQQFNLSLGNRLNLDPTDITEFADLNNAVRVMSKKAGMEYDTLKSFTENASHELQTPLAIIRSKLELLMQTENLGEEQTEYIQSVYEACNRLSKLNQSLLLLTKIDNNQFTGKEELQPDIILTRILNNYEELILSKQITVTMKMDINSRIYMNEAVAEILLSNLVTNAIRHNIEKGSITISLETNQLIVSNTGRELLIDPNTLFERFKKESNDMGSLGLGLSMVKKICDQNGFAVSYSYADSIHSIRVVFK